MEALQILFQCKSNTKLNYNVSTSRKGFLITSCSESVSQNQPRTPYIFTHIKLVPLQNQILIEIF